MLCGDCNKFSNTKANLISAACHDNQKILQLGQCDRVSYGKVNLFQWQARTDGETVQVRVRYDVIYGKVKALNREEWRKLVVKSTVVFVGWLLNVPATCECISGTDLLRQFYVLPH